MRPSPASGSFWARWRRRANDWLTVFPNAAASASAVRAALAAAIADDVSYWDALLITTAEAGYTLILTKELQDGSRLRAPLKTQSRGP